ncbi:DUF1573 domain-containing protein [Puniceicoccaceae bacterium K14]|nr:DUF1573 domain-containing protein [Puniceicoccaceae bacterium K14]
MIIGITKSGLIFFILVLSTYGSGALVFEEMIVEVEAPPNEEFVEVDFPFTVEGSEPAVIKTIDTPCTCLKTQIGEDNRKIWQPGESSFIRGVFEIGTFRGTVEKRIYFTMDNGNRRELIILMTTPELMTIEPEDLKWAAGSERDEKTITIELSPDYPINIKTISNSNPSQFDHQIETIAEGKEYRVRIKPKAVNSQALGVIRIETDCENKRHKNYQAFMAVEQKGFSPNRKK